MVIYLMNFPYLYSVIVFDSRIMRLKANIIYFLLTIGLGKLYLIL